MRVVAGAAAAVRVGVGDPFGAGVRETGRVVAVLLEAVLLEVEGNATDIGVVGAGFAVREPRTPSRNTAPVDPMTTKGHRRRRRGGAAGSQAVVPVAGSTR